MRCVVYCDCDREGISGANAVCMLCSVKDGIFSEGSFGILKECDC